MHEHIISGACGPNNEGTIIDIGFDTQAGFEDVIRLCFDSAQSRSIYAFHTLYKEIIARDSGNDRPSFDPDDRYPFDVNKMYTQVQQDSTIMDLTGIDYVDTSNSFFLSRGHLSPNADFVYYSWAVS